MTATKLSRRRALDELITRQDEYEAWLALGRPGREAALEICRPATSPAAIGRRRARWPRPRRQRQPTRS
jgi:putative ABC transport system permease protein